MPDYIVVGGGSAGCAVAGRLSEDSTARVTLFEAGPPDKSIWIRLPVTFYKSFQSSMMQWFNAEPLQHQNNMVKQLGQSRVLGGGSSLNAMVYMRGAPSDFDRWEEHGAEGWSYKDVLPYFRKAEHNEVFFERRPWSGWTTLGFEPKLHFAADQGLGEGLPGGWLAL